MGLPVVVIRGMLEAGKTQFIKESLLNGDFGDLGRTLILSMENGIEEISEADLKKIKASYVVLDNKEDYNETKISSLIKEYRPQVIFLEVNEMWDFNNMQAPAYFDFQQTMCIIDGTTFSAYLNNMRQQFNDMIKTSDLVIINRCKWEKETSDFKRNVKMINPQVTCVALDDKGQEVKLDTDLPFDVKAPIIDIKFKDYGIWYIDTFESKDRYDGKTVEFDCMAVFNRKLPKKTFIAGRMAMTCCAEDIQLLGHLLSYNGDLSLPDKQWVHVQAVVHYMKFKGSAEEQVVLEAKSIDKIPSPSEEDAVLMLR